MFITSLPHMSQASSVMIACTSRRCLNKLALDDKNFWHFSHWKVCVLCRRMCFANACEFSNVSPQWSHVCVPPINSWKPSCAANRPLVGKSLPHVTQMNRLFGLRILTAGGFFVVVAFFLICQLNTGWTSPLFSCSWASFMCRSIRLADL